MVEFISKNIRKAKTLIVAGAIAYQALFGYTPQYEYVKKAPVFDLDIDRYHGPGAAAFTNTESRDVAIQPEQKRPYRAKDDIIDHEEHHLDGYHDEFGINERIRAKNGEPMFKFPSYFRYG